MRQVLNKSITFVLQEMHICQDNFPSSVFKITLWHAIIFSEPIYAFNSVFANYLPFIALYFLCFRTLMYNKFYYFQDISLKNIKKNKKDLYIYFISIYFKSLKFIIILKVILIEITSLSVKFSYRGIINISVDEGLRRLWNSRFVFSCLLLFEFKTWYCYWYSIYVMPPKKQMHTSYRCLRSSQIIPPHQTTIRHVLKIMYSQPNNKTATAIIFVVPIKIWASLLSRILYHSFYRKYKEFW